MKTLIKSIFGSKLYGTEIATSDTDYKFLFLPDAQDLIMQRAAKNIQQNSKSSDKDSKNSSEDVDCEGFSLQQWFHMLTQGQTLAVEMLFIPEKSIVGEVHPLWKYIQSNRDKLVSRKVSPFVGYCRAQSSKFCVKAERVLATQMVVEFLEPLCSTTVTLANGRASSSGVLHEPLNTILKHLKLLSTMSPYIEIQYGKESHNDNWFMCCGRQIPLTASIFKAYQMYSAVLADYGKRAKIAASSNGVDWKSLYHSLRIAYEANELLTTGFITLPRPEAKLLVKIRQGEYSYQEVSDMIQDQVDLLEGNLLTTTLRNEPDYQWIEEVIYEAHRDVIMGYLEPD
jgi:hypothetical protein